MSIIFTNPTLYPIRDSLFNNRIMLVSGRNILNNFLHIISNQRIVIQQPNNGGLRSTYFEIISDNYPTVFENRKGIKLLPLFILILNIGRHNCPSEEL